MVSSMNRSTRELEPEESVSRGAAAAQRQHSHHEGGFDELGDVRPNAFDESGHQGLGIHL